jgi:hypothetical protein
MTMVDPLDLKRCEVCGHTLEPDTDERATVIWCAYGWSGLICGWCGWRYGEDTNEAEKELSDD